MYGAKLQRLIKEPVIIYHRREGGLSILRGDQSLPTEFKEGDSGKFTAN